MEQVFRYQVLGGMSGTSLDGLDLALCSFEHHPRAAVSWRFKIEAAQTIAYPPSLENELRNAHTLSGRDLIELDRRFGKFIGQSADAFLQLNAAGERPDLFVSHGHTIFHEPDKGFTFQLGSPAVVGVTAGCRVLGDLRSMDVTLGGQGAPLVPIGDHLLFSEYDACVNLGGFANLSLIRNEERIAWDVCPLNFVLNVYAPLAGSDLAYDKDGALARKGMVIDALFQQLERLEFYDSTSPKSLGREWVETHVVPLLSDEYEPSDILRTWVEHAASRIAADLSELQGAALFTGGGVHNTFLMERLQELCPLRVVIAEPLLADYKEALVFAFLGVRWLRKENNTLATVTGASSDVCGGLSTV